MRLRAEEKQELKRRELAYRGHLLRAGGARQSGDPDRRWDRHWLDRARGGARFECRTSRTVHRRRAHRPDSVYREL